MESTATSLIIDNDFSGQPEFRTINLRAKNTLTLSLKPIKGVCMYYPFDGAQEQNSSFGFHIRSGAPKRDNLRKMLKFFFSFIPRSF